MEPGERVVILVKHAMPEIVPGTAAAAWGLSAAGRAACAPLAARLAAFSPDRVVASAEPKAAETGALAASILGVPVSTAPGLHEHDQDGTPYLEPEPWRSLVAAFFARPDERVHGRETATEAADRFAGAVGVVLDTHPAGRTVVVAHGRVISLFVARTNAVDPFALWKRPGLPSFVVLSLPGLEVIEVVERLD